MKEQSRPGRIVRRITGRVVSARRDKSIAVLFQRRIRHPLYGKYINRSSKVHAHDEHNECQQDDLVVIRECRPISKTKSWVLERVLDRPAGQQSKSEKSS